MYAYEEKFEYLINHFGEFCPIAAEKGKLQKDKVTHVTELHHLLHNTKVNKRLYPLLIDSILNLRPVSNHFHLKWPSWGNITPFNAQKMEQFLFFHPQLSIFVNEIK